MGEIKDVKYEDFERAQELRDEISKLQAIANTLAPDEYKDEEPVKISRVSNKRNIKWLMQQFLTLRNICLQAMLRNYSNFGCSSFSKETRNLVSFIV